MCQLRPSSYRLARDVALAARDLLEPQPEYCALAHKSSGKGYHPDEKILLRAREGDRHALVAIGPRPWGWGK